MSEIPDVGLAEKERRQFVADFMVLLERADFRRVLWHLIDSPEFCRAHGLPTLHPQTGQLLPPDQTYFADGRRSIGVGLTLTIQKLSPKRYMNMLNEAMGVRNQQPSPPVQVQSLE